ACSLKVAQFHRRVGDREMPRCKLAREDAVAVVEEFDARAGGIIAAAQLRVDPRMVFSDAPQAEADRAISHVTVPAALPESRRRRSLPAAPSLPSRRYPLKGRAPLQLTLSRRPVHPTRRDQPAAAHRSPRAKGRRRAPRSAR